MPSPTTPESDRKISRGYTELSWKSSEDNDKQNAPYYVIYASNYPVDTDNPDNIIAQRIRSVNYVYAPVDHGTPGEYFAFQL